MPVPPALADLFDESPRLREAFALIGDEERRCVVAFVEGGASDGVRLRRAALVAMTLARYPSAA